MKTVQKVKEVMKEEIISGNDTFKETLSMHVGVYPEIQYIALIRGYGGV